MGMEISREEIIPTHEVIHVQLPIKKRRKKPEAKAGQFSVLRTSKKQKKVAQTNTLTVEKRIEPVKKEPDLTLALPRPSSRIVRKVAILSWNSLYGDSEGQAGAYVSRLASALKAEGLAVHVFTRKRKDQAYNEKVEGVSYHRVYIDPALSLEDGIYKFGTRIYEGIKRIELKEGPFDIIHCNDWQPMQVVWRLHKESARDFVVTLHVNNDINELQKIPCTGLRSESKVMDLMKKSRMLICADEGFKRDIQMHFPLSENKISVIPGAFKWDDFQGTEDQGQIKRRYDIGPIDPLILFVGTFNSNYAPDILVDAIPALLKNNPQARFLLVGDGELMWPIKVKAHYLYFEHAVRLVGHKQGHELCELFRAADIVVVPNRVQTGPYQVLAAWSAKKPLVATQAGGCNLIKHEENAIQIYDNPSSVVWGIERILFDWDRGHKIAEKGWEHVEANYTWNAIARKIKEIYNGK